MKHFPRNKTQMKYSRAIGSISTLRKPRDYVPPHTPHRSSQSPPGFETFESDKDFLYNSGLDYELVVR